MHLLMYILFMISDILVICIIFYYSLHRVCLRGPHRPGTGRVCDGKTRWLLDSSWILISEEKFRNFSQNCVKIIFPSTCLLENAPSSKSKFYYWLKLFSHPKNRKIIRKKFSSKIPFLMKNYLVRRVVDRAKAKALRNHLIFSLIIIF